MARKRLLEEPPAALSSFEEEETHDQEEEPQNSTVKTQQNAAGEKSNDDRDGTDDEEEEEKDDGAKVDKKKPDLPSKTPNPNSVPAFESDSNADSEDTETAQPPSPSLSGFTIKAISSKRKYDPKPEQPKKEEDVDDKKTQKGAGGIVVGNKSNA